MSKHTHIERWVLALGVMLALCVGFIRPALAEESSTTQTSTSIIAKTPDEAKITKVIVAPKDSDTSRDTYTISFIGSGTVESVNGKLVSGGVEQDKTLKVNDKVPAIESVTLTGVDFKTVKTRGNASTTAYQASKSISLSSVLANVKFPHAGVYTYEVFETDFKTLIDGAIINASLAKYTLRIWVTNSTGTSNTELTVANVDKVTVEKTQSDNGDPISAVKVDPTYPITANDGYITDENPDAETDCLAGEEKDRGRDVYGFTFANEYVKGGPLYVTKITEGVHADKKRPFLITLEVKDAAAKAAPGCCITYEVVGGEDKTENSKRITNEEVLDVNSSMVEFVGDTATIKADLKEGDYIKVTGLYGSLASVANIDNGKGPHDSRRRFANGLKQGSVFIVTETTSDGYAPTAYYIDIAEAGFESTAKPSIDRESGENTNNTASFTKKSPEEISKYQYELNVADTVSEHGTAVYVVNYLAESKVSPTGIFIDNLPYIIMITVPVAVFAALFVGRRMRHAA